MSLSTSILVIIIAELPHNIFFRNPLVLSRGRERAVYNCTARSPQPVDVTVLEWGRGPVGRTARRRVRIPPLEGEMGGGTEISFDHAAPYFDARTLRFWEFPLAQWRADGRAEL